MSRLVSRIIYEPIPLFESDFVLTICFTENEGLHIYLSH